MVRALARSTTGTSFYDGPVMSLPPHLRHLGAKAVAIVRNEGTEDEERLSAEAHVQPESGFFAVDTQIYEGDVVEYADARGGITRVVAADVEVFDEAPPQMQHTRVKWGKAPPPRVPPIRRLGLKGLHPEVLDASSDLFTDGHYSQAVFEALKALEGRVKRQSGLDDSGKRLMGNAFSGNPPPINLAVETGRSGEDEQEGLKLLFMGVSQGIRNPKGHERVKQDNPQRTLEYLALVSVLFRRLDDANEQPPG